MSNKPTYAQILKASSIMAGSAGVVMALGMVRTKVAAVLVGTAGIGLLASFTALQGIMASAAGLGIQKSAVREIAVAFASGDRQAMGRSVLALRRVCWLTGIAGMLAMAVFSPLISRITFGSEEYALDVSALGIMIFLMNLSGGQLALIQGMRRIGDIAQVNIWSAVLATVVAVVLYSWLGLQGIVPAMVAGAAMQLTLSWHFARSVPVPAVELTWRETFSEAGSMIRLGLAFMWSALLGAAVVYGTVTLINQQISLEAAGFYSAAFALSCVFVNFVLVAMEADYYPRLTGVANDKAAVNRLVNEQTEIGLLLAVPGLLATMALAPWIVHVFYSSEFLPAVQLLQCFVLGCAGRVISWPLGFVMLALGKGRWFLLTETSFNLLHILLIALCLLFFGILGVAIAFSLMYVIYTLAVYAVARRLTGFEWSSEAKQIGGLTLSALVATFVLVITLPPWAAALAGGALAILVGLFSLRGLVKRIGEDHRITRAILKLPGLRTVCGL